MKIYFCGSIRGGRDLAHTYEHIIKMLQGFGTVLTEHVGSDEVIQKKDRVLSDRQIHDRDLGWIVESDLLVAEVTVPSLGVGYEIGRAIEIGKPVLCLYDAGSGKALSAMIAGSDKVEMKLYRQTEEIEGILEAFFKSHAPRRTS
ncbi:MAG: nucleoside 2-deoxyribosyltransferase [Bacteroidia bacterium]|nr:MAG: nucleoside 2-deoxyribosyltransferase [Bacteroidia bacterium]